MIHDNENVTDMYLYYKIFMKLYLFEKYYWFPLEGQIDSLKLTLQKTNGNYTHKIVYSHISAQKGLLYMMTWDKS